MKNIWYLSRCFNTGLLCMSIYTNKTIIVYRCNNDNKAETHNKYNVRYINHSTYTCESVILMLLKLSTPLIFFWTKHIMPKAIDWSMKGIENVKPYLLWKHLNNYWSKLIFLIINLTEICKYQILRISTIHWKIH